MTKASAPELTEAVLTLAKGQRYLSAGLAQRLALRDLAGDPRSLTARQIDVLRLLAQGQSVATIAESMG